MTLRPVETHDIRGLEGPPYKVGPLCANPGCHKPADHAHHIASRRQLGGPFDWVEIVDVTMPNLCGLCVDCHEYITGIIGGHRSVIRLHEGTWWWCQLKRTIYTDNGKLGEEDYIRVGPLDPHPPTLAQLTERSSVHPVSGSDICPTCGQAKRRRAGQAKASARRRRATWRVKVPADELEDGATVLDTLVDDLAIVLGYDGDNARYYVLVPAMAFCQMNRQQFAREIEGLAR